MNIQNEAARAAKAFQQRPLLNLTDPTSWVLFCGVAVITVVIIGTTFVASHFRERALEGSESDLENISQILARHYDHKLDELCAPQDFVASYLERQGLSSGDYARLASTGEFASMLRNAVDASADDAAKVHLFDQQGKLMISSGVEAGTPEDISDRGYFATLRDQAAGAAMTQIEVIEGQPSREKRIVLARRISAPDGRLLGVISRTVPAIDLERFLSSISVRDLTTLLVTDAAAEIARQPSSLADHVSHFFGPVLFVRLTAVAAATLRLLDPQIDDQRIVSSRRLPRYPLTVIASTTGSAALATWRDETRMLALVAILTAIVTGSMMIAIVRHLKEQTRRLDVAINNMPQALLLFDPLERLVVKNTRYSEMFNNGERIAIGRRFKDMICEYKAEGPLPPHVTAYCESVREALWQRGRAQKVVEGSDGRYLQIVNQALDEGGWVSTIEDVTDRHRAEELTIRLAQYDSLTGLPNRASFLSHVRHLLTGLKEDQAIAVLFVDLDEFKTVNDTLGHHIGDELLKSIALELRDSVEPSEFIARLGGDEFAVVSPPFAGGADAILALVRRIYDAIRRPHQCGGHSLSIDASIGIALAPKDGKASEGVLQRADLAMYAAKAQGRKSYRFFDPLMEARARERLLLEVELRKALVDGQIEVHFQPIHDFRRGRIVACEALARWRHPTRGYVPPTTFIPIAEQAGLIGQLGEMVLRQACHEAMHWPSDITIAVNVSPLQLQGSIFSLKVISALQDSGLPASRLEVEITEAVLIGDDETALKILHELKAIGVRIALDDFGTGYSSLSYLLRFPFDKIKIDRRFVEAVEERRTSKGIIKAVITMAADLRMVTTAEGVESEEQRDILRSLGCDQIQGFLIAPALPAEDFSEILSSPMRDRA